MEIVGQVFFDNSAVRGVAIEILTLLCDTHAMELLLARCISRKQFAADADKDDGKPTLIAFLYFCIFACIWLNLRIAFFKTQGL